MDAELVALIGDREAGRVRRDRRGRLSFVYDEAWRSARHARPLSISMPLAAAEHGHAAIDTFLWGLLPDNALVLDRWARRFHVSARNAFALMSHVGEDCAGAVPVRAAGGGRRLPRLRSGTGRMARRARRRRTAALAPSRPFRLADASRYGAVQLGRRSAEDGAAARERAVGRAFRAYSHDTYPQAADG